MGHRVVVHPWVPVDRDTTVVMRPLAKSGAACWVCAALTCHPFTCGWLMAVVISALRVLHVRTFKALFVFNGRIRGHMRAVH